MTVRDPPDSIRNAARDGHDEFVSPEHLFLRKSWIYFGTGKSGGSRDTKKGMSVSHLRRCFAGLEREAAQTVDWRRRQLLAAGFPDDLALRLARTRGTDLHVLLNLVDLGCPPELAVRIADTPLPCDRALAR